jgi:hypothetical protein
MKHTHPFEWLSIQHQKQAFVFLLILTLAVMGGLQVFDAQLKTDAAPAGIVSFEFAGSLAAAQGIMASWGPRGSLFAGLSLGLDFLFLLSYAGGIGLGCILTARALSRTMKKVSLMGATLAWAQLGAALLDTLENISLIQVLSGAENVFWPVLAFWCAVPKFFIVAVGLFYIVAGVVLFRVNRAGGSLSDPD